jgi:hypothetical protein
MNVPHPTQSIRLLSVIFFLRGGMETKDMGVFGVWIFMLMAFEV